MTQIWLRFSYEVLTENEKEIYWELVIAGCDREYVFDLLERIR